MIKVAYCLFPLSLLALPAQASFDCWVNKDGVRECGEVIPPEYVPKGHDVLSRDGRVIDKVAPEMSKEERERVIQQELEEKRRKEEARLQAEEDRRLLDLYPTEDDIIQAREGKILSVKARIRVTQTQLDFYERSLVEAKKGLQYTKLSPQERKNLEEDIAQLDKQIAKFGQTIKDSETEIDTIKEEFKGYQERYRAIQERMDGGEVLPSSAE